MKTFIRRASTAVTALVLAVGLMPADATAIPAGTRPEYYKWLWCSTPITGTITSAQAGDYDGNHFVELAGMMELCQPPTEPKLAYGLAAYSAAGAVGKAIPFGVYGSATYPYRSRISVSPEIHAVCLIADETTRLACVSVSWTTIDAVVRHEVGDPLPVDSPLVAARAYTDMLAGYTPIGPGCQTCD